MAKSKRAPALFEVIEPHQLQGSSSRFPLPKWWRVGKARSPNYPPVSDPEPKAGVRENIIKLVPQLERPVAQENAAVLPPSRAEQPPATTTSGLSHVSPEGTGDGGGSSTGSGHKPPIVNVGGGRVSFSLNPVSLGVVFAAVVLAVFGAYQLGKSSEGPGPRTDDIAATLQGARDSSVVNVPREEMAPTRKAETGRADTAQRTGARSGGYLAAKESAKPAASPAAHTPTPAQAANTAVPAPTRKLEAEVTPRERPLADAAPSTAVRQKGLNYLYIVRFRNEHGDDAAHARKWLAEKGISTTVEESGGSLCLVSTEGFDYGNPADRAKCQELQAKLKSLSPAYRQACKADRRDRYYDFDKPELRKLKD